MYIVAVEGQPEKILDLAGVYRVVALANPLDGHPMTVDVRTVVAQMTGPRDRCLFPASTRDALHALVWGAATGQVTTYRFTDGPAIAMKASEGSEYTPPKREFGQVKALKSDGRYRERRYGTG